MMGGPRATSTACTPAHHNTTRHTAKGRQIRRGCCCNPSRPTRRLRTASFRHYRNPRSTGSRLQPERCASQRMPFVLRQRRVGVLRDLDDDSGFIPAEGVRARRVILSSCTVFDPFWARPARSLHGREISRATRHLYLRPFGRKDWNHAIAPADLALTPPRDGSIVSPGAEPPQGPPPAAASRRALRVPVAHFLGPRAKKMLPEKASP